MPGANNGMPLRPNLPIVGQPFTFRDWWPAALINCSCDEKNAMLIQGIGNPATCPTCGRTVMIQGMAVEPSSGQIGVQLVQVVLSKKAKDA